MAFLPADTRLPEHTIWAHNSLASAFQGCVEVDGSCRPAFLLVTIGPGQDFIAQTRRTLDLWSGSYQENGERKGAAVYLESQPALKSLLKKPRSLNPSFQNPTNIATQSNLATGEAETAPAPIKPAGKLAWPKIFASLCQARALPSEKYLAA